MIQNVLLQTALVATVCLTGCSGKQADDGAPAKAGADSKSSSGSSGKPAVVRESPDGGSDSSRRAGEPPAPGPDSAKPPQADGYETPEAAFEAFREAYQTRDWQTIAASLSPTGREEVIGLLLFRAARLAEREAAVRPALVALLEKHGLGRGEAQNLAAGRDPAGEKVSDTLRKEIRLSYRDYDNITPPDNTPLHVVLELTGRPAVEATAYGHIRITAAQDDTGKVLALTGPSDDPSEEWLPFYEGRNREFNSATTVIRLYLDRALPKATKLTRLEGSLKLLTGGETRSITVPKILAKEPGDPIEDEVLRKAGLSVTYLGVEDTRKFGETVRIGIKGEREGAAFSLKEVTLISGDGKRIQESARGASYDDGVPSELRVAGRPIPPNAGLRLTVAVGQEPLDVPFKLEDVPIPSPEEEVQADVDGGERSGGRVPARILIDYVQDAVQDKQVFLADLLAWLDESEAETGQPFAGWKLTDLKIDGDTAAGIIVREQGQGVQRQPMAFTRIDGRWFVEGPKTRTEPEQGSARPPAPEKPQPLPPRRDVPLIAWVRGSSRVDTPPITLQDCSCCEFVSQ